MRLEPGNEDWTIVGEDTDDIEGDFGTIVESGDRLWSFPDPKTIFSPRELRCIADLVEQAERQAKERTGER